MPSIGPLELAIILILAVLILGPKRLPDAARGLGRGVREFKTGITSPVDEVRAGLTDGTVDRVES